MGREERRREGRGEPNGCCNGVNARRMHAERWHALWERHAKRQSSRGRGPGVEHRHRSQDSGGAAAARRPGDATRGAGGGAGRAGTHRRRKEADHRAAEYRGDSRRGPRAHADDAEGGGDVAEGANSGRRQGGEGGRWARGRGYHHGHRAEGHDGPISRSAPGVNTTPRVPEVDRIAGLSHPCVLAHVNTVPVLSRAVVES